MTQEQKLYLIGVIRGYDFAYRSTKQECYKVIRDRILKQLKKECTTKLYIVKAA